MAMQTLGGTRSEINITPFIDVLLVLLVIFMVNSIRMVIPTNIARDGEAAPVGPPALVLELSNDGQYRLNTILVPAESLAAVLTRVFAMREPSLLFVKSGSQRLYGETIHAIDVARGAGVEVVALAP